MSVQEAQSRRYGAALVVLLLGCGVLGSLVPPTARSQDHNFAGSIQTNYMWVPTDKNARDQTLDGFTNELSLKVAVDFSDAVSANVKLCYGCHGVELDMAFTDLRVVDELNFRAGRINPAFGDFPLRHDPANHLTSDKPLPYDMGRMLRIREFNLGVLPVPYVDTGLEVNGTHWFGDSVQLDYAAYVVAGLRGGSDDVDLDFIQSRSSYYIDNNSEPAYGGRLAATWDASNDVMFTLGGSGMAGHYDPDRKLGYVVLGADFYARIYRLDLHAEYLVRRTRMSLGDNPDERFRYGPGESGRYSNYFLKDGFYVSASSEITPHLELVARFDGLGRVGNVTATSPLRKRSMVLRYTGGFNVVFDGSVRLKISGEFYDFSDFDDEFVANLGFVAAF